MILDSRLPEDTLFMILEEDFRFWPPYQDGVEEYERRAAHAVKLGPQVPEGRGWDQHPRYLEPTAEGRGHEGKGKGWTPPVATSYHKRIPKAEVGPEQGPDWGLQQEVADMIRLATFCHRQKRGQIIWASYNCFDWSGEKVGFGSQFMMLGKQGARDIAHAIMNEPTAIQANHVDLFFKHWLRQSIALQKRVNFCLVYPPVGNYSEHVSACEFQKDKKKPKPNHRKPKWEELWCCPGTRVQDDYIHSSNPEYCFRDKFIGGIKQNGWSGFWQPLPPDHKLHSDEYLWLSFPDSEFEPAPIGNGSLAWLSHGAAQGKGVYVGKAYGGASSSTSLSPPPATTPAAATTGKKGDSKGKDKPCPRKARMFRQQKARYNRRVWADSKKQVEEIGKESIKT